MKPYTLDLMIALQEGEEPTQAWWDARYEWATRRAGGMPPEVAGNPPVTIREQEDPDNGDRFACVTITMPEGTGLGRTTELAHMLTSTLTAEGFTMRQGGKRVEIIPGEPTGPLEASFGGTEYTEARVCSGRCLACVFASEHRIGCCGEGSAFSLADIGSILLQGDEELARRVLALPGELDGVKWHPYLAGGACVFHDPSCGCTLPPDRMPLQCRTYLCYPDKLLTPDLAVDYGGFVDALEEEEMFVEEHMREQGGVDFDSPLDQIKEAAAKAFAAWKAGT